MKHVFKYRFLYLGLLAVTLTGCGSSSGSSSGGVVTPPAPCIDGSGASVFWTANREAAVNTAGGGYNVYYSKTTGFNIGDGGVMSQAVPYVSGATAAPTCTEITLASGTWYVRVTATSALDAPGTTGGSESVASVQTTVAVP